MGYYCSRECLAEDKKEKFKGENNHQFGLKGSLNSSFKGEETTKCNHSNIDIYVYKPKHPLANSNGRVLKHRLIVEENYKLFEDYFFDVQGGVPFLKKGYDVHHKDGDHSNNLIENLEILTRSQHTSHHNKQKTIVRDQKGRILKLVKK